MDTLADVLQEAFNATQKPKRQEDPFSEHSSDKFRVLGNLPTETCFLYNYLTRLARCAKEKMDTRGRSPEEDLEVENKLKVLQEKIQAVRDLMWVLIKEDYPDSATADCRGLIILPDWKVGGILLTEDDKTRIKHEEELQKNPLLQALREAFG